VNGPSNDERERLLGLETEARKAALSGAFVPGKRRNLLRRPLGAGAKGTLAGGQECDRNAPCPCGSGKKYKHCCRAAGKAWRRARANKEHG